MKDETSFIISKRFFGLIKHPTSYIYFKHPSKSKATTRFKDIDISSNRSLCLQHYNVLKPNTSFMLKPLKTNYRAILHFTYVP